MKKIWLAIWLGFGLAAWGTYAQTLNDLYTYNSEYDFGTARYLGTATTMMSLGADMSAVSDNPAGAAYFTTNRITYSPGFNHLNNTAAYNGNKTLSNDYSFYHHLMFTHQLGFVMPYVSDVSDWNKVALGINYQRSQNYFNRIKMEGTSPNMQSLADYFVINATGIPTGDLDVYSGETDTEVYEWLGENYGTPAQHAFLGYQTYIIDPVNNDDDNTEYTSNAQYSSPLFHSIVMNTSGHKAFGDFFLAAEYKEKLALGVSFRASHLEYSEKRKITEEGYDANSTLQYLAYQSNLSTEADGYGFKLGATYKLNDRIKISAAYHSPVWWEINEKTTESVSTDIKDNDDWDNDGDTNEIFRFDLDPATVNTFEPYRMVSPGKFLIGASYVNKKYGFISVKYTRRNWQNLHLEALSDDAASMEYFDRLTEAAQEAFGIETTLAVGGEFKVDHLMIRAGYKDIANPVKALENFHEHRWTFGLGYDFGNIDVDFGIVSGNQKQIRQILPVGLTNTYDIHTRRNQYVFTVKANF
ncbi:MAG: hypothetical protein GXO24_03695 [Chlorobi bacterium]|nr:hypothetical protein [Chlorobiota bacterium]